MEEIRYERNNGRTLEDDYLCETAWEKWISEDHYD